MCGIVTIFNYNSNESVDRSELLRIRDHMITRGPDGAGEWYSKDNRLGMGHRRLSIIDLSESGSQPMCNEDGTVWITFNGEIYNYQTLRSQLIALGHSFRSSSDTEVIIHGYEEWGIEVLLNKLRGMFAFALYDSRPSGRLQACQPAGLPAAAAPRLIIARDPFGIKPLYYSDNGKTIKIASQVKALLAGGKVDTSIEPAGHVGFFLWGHVPEPYTLYKGIRSLPAGSYMCISDSSPAGLSACQPVSLSPLTYCSIPAILSEAERSTVSLSREDIREKLREALFDTVKHHLIADVPIGMFLSAGLDSSILTAIAKELGVKVLNSITLGFSEFRGSTNDETIFAEQLSQHYGTYHQTRWVAKEDFHNDHQQLLEVMDQPTIDGVNSYFISKVAKEAGLKVALSGVGGDELFAGYSHFKQIPLMVRLLRPIDNMRWLGSGFRYVAAPLLKRFVPPKYAGLLEYGGNYSGAYLLRRSLFMPWELPEVLDPDLVRQGWDELQCIARLDQTTHGIERPQYKISALETTWYMRNQLLRDTDWASMAHSLEIRSPLVDIELMRAITHLYKDNQPLTKMDMVNSPATPLPEAVLNRPKTGFSVPVREWLMGVSKSTNKSAQRGLRDWATLIYAGQGFTRPGTGGMKHYLSVQHKPTRSLSQPPACVGLIAPEVCTRGGIQSFMLRIAEVIAELVQDNKAARGYCVSLNDSTDMLRHHPVMPAAVNVWGADRSKLKLIAYALVGMPFTDILFVGHVGQAPVAYLLKKLGQVRSYYVILHGIEAWNRIAFLKRHALSGADAIIATTRFTAEECARLNNIPADHFQIIPLCADERSIAPSANFRLNGEFKLLCVARQDTTERYKGFEQIFHAIVLLKPYHRRIHLNLVGSGDDQSRLKSVANKLGLQSQITFWGTLSDEDLSAAYEDCDVYVMPSKKEGFGIVFLEAMRHGKPCIGGNHGGTPDVIEHGRSGYLVEYEDVSMLAKDISKLAEDASLRRSMGATGREMVKGKFSSHCFREQYKQLAIVCKNK